MLRQLICLTVLACAAQLALAGEAGTVIFAAGASQSAGKPAQLGMAVQEGDLLSTGADGYLYIKTIDNGLFILRPSTRARIASYHIDAQNPANTRIKLELLSGVARSQSGQAVKQARQNFRFNTPVAAIGVRGTDFTVFTDQDTSRVAVISGGITVSGFVGACRPEGSGPCEGNASRELSALQKGQLLQIQRGQSAPQLMQGGALAPDAMAPPRSDEPLAKNGLGNTEPSLDPKKAASVQITIPPVDVTPPAPAPAPPPPAPPLPAREISWGRWQALRDLPANASLSKPDAERLAMNEAYVLFRGKNGEPYVAPERGSAGFSLLGGEAVVRDTKTNAKSMAGVENGQLLVDFGKASFTTSLDVVQQSGRTTLAAQGTLAKDGMLEAMNRNTAAQSMTVNGVLGGNDNASYLFQGLLPEHRVVSGVTLWGR